MWRPIDQDTINKLIDSIPKRMELLIENKGDYISY